jgi:hypothetical protein
MGEDKEDSSFFPVLVIGVILYAIERVMMFVWLRNQPDSSLLIFMYGSPPFSIIRILFGLEFNINTVLDYLNIVMLIQAIVQVVHFFANVYLVNWIWEKIKRPPAPVTTI